MVLHRGHPRTVLRTLAHREALRVMGPHLGCTSCSTSYSSSSSSRLAHKLRYWSCHRWAVCVCSCQAVLVVYSLLSSLHSLGLCPQYQQSFRALLEGSCRMSAHECCVPVFRAKRLLWSVLLSLTSSAQWQACALMSGTSSRSRCTASQGPPTTRVAS